MLRLAGHLYQNELAAACLAETGKDQLALSILKFRIDRHFLLAAVPDAGLAGAVGTFSEGAFEIEIRKAVIGRGHCETLVTGVHRGALRNRPGLSRSADLEPQIEV